jgi:hypothetical protein
VGALRDAALEGSFESVSTTDHGIQTYGTKVRITTEDEHGHLPFGVVNSVVPQKDVAG